MTTAGCMAPRRARQARQIIGDLDERGILVDSGEIVHRYPHCWRCETPLIFRISDDWFIAVEEIRPKLRAANEKVGWVPEHFGKRMDDWLVNMGDWNISRKRFFGLPLPFYPCSCGQLTVIGSLDELREKAVSGLGQLQELHRPWIDEVVIRCDGCGEDVRRIPEVGDVWLDAGIVPLSTLGWQSEEWVEAGNGTGAAKGLTGAPLPDHVYWEKWFPATWVSEMREQIRLWFHSIAFMSMAMVDRLPYGSILSYEKLLDEHGEEMHGSKGNAIDADEAFERMGADVMRWMYCSQPPTQNLRFGYGPAEEVKRKLLTLWNSASFFIQYAEITEFAPSFADLVAGPADAEGLTDLDRWMISRTHELVAECAASYEGYLTAGVTGALDRYIDDLSNWYIRLNRRRFWEETDVAAFRTLWFGLVQAIRVIAAIMPFLAEHLWQHLVAGVAKDASKSVFLAGWPAFEASAIDRELLDAMAATRRVVELGRAARSSAGVKLRQPLPQLVVEGGTAAAPHVELICAELRVRDVELGEIEGSSVRAKPDLPSLGPKLGRELPTVRQALADGDFELLPEGGVSVLGHELAAEEVYIERSAPDGFALAEETGLVVALDTRIDDELALEGRALDVIHELQRMRRDAGLELTDRIEIRYPGDDGLAEVFEAHGERIAGETLAVKVEAAAGDGEGLEIAKAER